MMYALGPAPRPQVVHGLARPQSLRTKTLLFVVISVAERPRKARPALREERTRHPDQGSWGCVHPEEGGGHSSRRNCPPTQRPRARRADTVFQELESREALGEGARGGNRRGPAARLDLVPWAVGSPQCLLSSRIAGSDLHWWRWIEHRERPDDDGISIQVQASRDDGDDEA